MAIISHLCCCTSVFSTQRFFREINFLRQREQCYYRLQRSWGKVMFLQASVILFTGGEYLPPPPGSKHPPLGADTPPGPGAPPSPRSRHPLEQTPLGAGIPPPFPEQSMLGDTVNTRAARILLECNLVRYLIVTPYQ